MSSTLQSENRQLKAEVQQLNEQLNNLLGLLKSQSIEMERQRGLIHYAQHLIQGCPDCAREWRQNLEA